MRFEIRGVIVDRHPEFNRVEHYEGEHLILVRIIAAESGRRKIVDINSCPWLEISDFERIVFLDIVGYSRRFGDKQQYHGQDVQASMRMET